MKPALLKLHRWLGSMLAILFLLQALTGLALLYRDELEPVIHPELRLAQAGPASLQAVVDLVERTHPDVSLSRIEFPLDDNQALFFKVKDAGGTRIMGIDPHRLVIVRDGYAGTWPIEWLFLLHDSLHAGAIGEAFVGIEGLLLVFILVTGPIIWWPGIRNFKRGFTICWRSNSDLHWRTLHRVGGAILAIPLLVIATTGALLVWKDTVYHSLETFMPVERRPSPTVDEDRGEAVNLDTLVAAARERGGGAQPRQIRFLDDERVIAIWLDDPSVFRGDATQQYYFAAATGRPLAQYRPDRVPGASTFVDWLYPAHSALWGGLITETIQFVVVLGMLGLAITGPWLWWSRSRKRRRKAKARMQTASSN